ncbi:flippase-like domain-containing protein [Chloroflexales bacterium ZM16-3]|nr:flippase-like domain-containing protein [Chloroflexales bacterium ZM16-3]
MQAQRTLSSRHLSWLFKGAFILLFIYFLTRADLHTILASLLAAAPWPLLVSLLILPPFIWAKSVRWGVILRGMGAEPPSDGRLFIYYTIGLFLGGVTPGQFGDIAKGWYLKADDVPIKTAMTSVVVDRVCDMLIMALLGMAALTDYVGLVAPELLIGAQVGTVALALASGLLISERFRRWLAQLLSYGPLGRLGVGRLLDFQFSLISNSLLILLAYTILSIGLNLLRGWLLFVALGLNIPLFSVFAAITLIAIFQVLPVSIAGFGVREAILVITLQRYGYMIESAISLSLLLLLLNIQQIVVGFIVSLFFPVPAENR